MFESIVSTIANRVRKTIRAIGAATREMPWLAGMTILAIFVLL